jgi:hypothetical protein
MLAASVISLVVSTRTTAGVTAAANDAKSGPDEDVRTGATA